MTILYERCKGKEGKDALCLIRSVPLQFSFPKKKLSQVIAENGYDCVTVSIFRIMFILSIVIHNIKEVKKEVFSYFVLDSFN